jgi:hypothetical protein
MSFIDDQLNTIGNEGNRQQDRRRQIDNFNPIRGCNASVSLSLWIRFWIAYSL